MIGLTLLKNIRQLRRLENYTVGPVFIPESLFDKAYQNILEDVIDHLLTELPKDFQQKATHLPYVAAAKEYLKLFVICTAD